MPPDCKVGVDDGFPTNNGGPCVGHIPGGPFSADGSHPLDRYNANMSTLRNPVEMPYNCVTSLFPYLQLVGNRRKATTSHCMNYRNALLLYNCLLCVGQGHEVVSKIYKCKPPRLDAYLA